MTKAIQFHALDPKPGDYIVLKSDDWRVWDGREWQEMSAEDQIAASRGPEPRTYYPCKNGCGGQTSMEGQVCRACFLDVQVDKMFPSKA